MNRRSEISVELVNRHDIEVSMTTRQQILAEITCRQNVEAEVTARQQFEVIIEHRVTDGGYLASVRDETLYLQKDISVNGNELIMNG